MDKYLQSFAHVDRKTLTRKALINFFLACIVFHTIVDPRSVGRGFVTRLGDDLNKTLFKAGHTTRAVICRLHKQRFLRWIGKTIEERRRRVLRRDTITRLGSKVQATYSITSSVAKAFARKGILIADDAAVTPHRRWFIFLGIVHPLLIHVNRQCRCWGGLHYYGRHNHPKYGG